MECALRCIQEQHRESPIIAYCLNIECPSNLTKLCHLCLIDRHKQHEKDCLTYEEIKGKLVMSQLQMFDELTKILAEKFDETKRFYEKVLKNLDYRKQTLGKLQQDMDGPSYFMIKEGQIQDLKKYYKMNKEWRNMSYNFQNLLQYLQTLLESNAPFKQEEPIPAQQIQLDQIQTKIDFAKIQCENQCFQETLIQLEEPIKQISRYADLFFWKGYALHQLNRIEESLQFYDLSVKLNPKNSNAILYKGIALSDLNRNTEAIQCYDYAIMIDQKNPKIYINKGISLNDLRQSQEAIQCYDYAIMLDPQNQNAYMNKGNTLRELGRYQEAIQQYDIVIKLNPKNSKAFNNKGLALFNLKRNEETLVISCFNSSIFLDPNISDTYNNKGVALYAYQRYNEALIEYQNAIHLNPKEPLYYQNSANALRQLGRNIEADQLFYKAQQIKEYFK